MTFSSRAAAMVDRQIAHFGGGLLVTLRRRSTLRHKVQTSIPIASLTLGAAALLGATSLDLVVSSLTGTLVKGAQLTLAGNVYTTTNSVSVNDAGELLGVGITPALLAAAAVDIEVLVTRSWSEQIYRAMRTEMSQEQLGGWVEGAAASYRLSAASGVRAPEEGDLLTADDGKTLAVKRVAASAPGAGQAIAWQIWVGIGT